jgi:hypothetical protein
MERERDADKKTNAPFAVFVISSSADPHSDGVTEKDQTDTQCEPPK